GGDPKRLTSGTWSMPISHPPGTPASAIVWTPDGAGIVITRGGGRGANPPDPAPGQRGAPSTGSGQAAFGETGLQVVHVNDLSMTPLGGNGSHPQFSPDGKMIATNNGGVFTIGANTTPPAAPAPPAGGGTATGAGRGGNT